MAVSYKKEAMEILSRYPSTNIKVNNKNIKVYSYNINETLSLNLEQIIKDNGLKGKTFPIAVVQYCTYIPWTNGIGPMIAFIWSWEGPWAFVYNVQFPEYSESGTLSLFRVMETDREIPSNYFIRQS